MIETNAGCGLPLARPAQSDGDPGGIPWLVFPWVLVRVPAVPRSILASIRYTSATASYQRARQQQLLLLERGKALAQRLGECIPLIEERPSRARLLALRRALFNGRAVPADGELAPLARVDAPLAAEISQWTEDQQSWRILVEQRDAAFVRDASVCGRELLRLLESYGVGIALRLANPLLAGHLSRLQARLDAALDGPARRTMARAARYFLRAALRTTPNAFFAATALATFSQRPPDGVPDLGDRAAQVGVSRVAVRRLAQALLTRPAFRRRLHLHLAATCWLEGGQFWAALDPCRQARYQPVPQMVELTKLLEGGRRRTMAWQSLEEAGIPAATIAEAVRLGVLEWSCSGQQDGADEQVTLSRVLWEALPEDLTLLDALAALERLQQACERVVAATATPGNEQGATADSSIEAGSALVVDTVCRNRLQLPMQELTPFFAEMVHYGAGCLVPTLLAEEAALLAVFHKLYRSDAAQPLLRFHRDYLEYCRQQGLGADHWQNTPALCARLDVPVHDYTTPFRCDIEALLRVADNIGVSYHPAATRFAGWTAAVSTRLSFRFRRATDGPASTRFHPTLWGADCMSLFPRYARLRFPGEVDITDGFRRWMARWPAVTDMEGSWGGDVDVRPVTTRRTLAMPGAAPNPDSIALQDLLVAPESPGGRLVLTENETGCVVTPVFLGVSATVNLPPIARFLLHLSGRRTSALELIYRAVNQIVLQALAEPGEQPCVLPDLYLGDHILLSPRTVVLSSATLPSISPPVDAEQFFRFQDWLTSLNLPAGLAQVRRAMEQREPLWVDFGHPVGVDNFLRYARGALAVAVAPPLLPDTMVGMRGRDGCYEAEYYVELAAGTALAQESSVREQEVRYET
ncbi:MAG: lantibiotic dehydratase [Chloroflexi bacterium]|nr:lantibiotic dehydratase [Chloroflexota bacterium]